jgi:hypothetical protein
MDSQPTPETPIPSARGKKGAIHGTVKYPWGAVRGAIVTAGEKSAKTNNAGAYEIFELDPAVYNVDVYVRFPGYETSAQRVELAAGEAKIVNFYLDFKKTTVEGYVYDQEGKPIVGATLSGFLSSKDTETVTTDSHGHFEVSRANPGKLFIRVNAPGYLAETSDFTAEEGRTTRLEFHLTPATCKIDGVITGTGGRPVQAKMLLYRSGIVIERTASNAETGHYEFAVVPGTYEINAAAPMYESKGWRGQISGDTKIDLALDLVREHEGPNEWE